MTVTVASLLVGAPGAVADPATPTDDDVRRAQEAVTSAEQSVAEMEVRLAQLSTEADSATLAVQQAGEAYTQALADAQDAQDESDEAARRSADAAGTAEQARRELVAIARQVARSGGSADVVEALLSADGFQDVARRTSAMDQITSKADEAVQAYQAAQLVAGALAQQADAAADDARAAQGAARTALDTAQRTADEADAAQRAAEAERSTLLTQLAAARDTSVETERRRQDAIDEERRRREEDQARRDREQAPDPEPTTPGDPDPTTPDPEPTTPADPEPTRPADPDPEPDPDPTTRPPAPDPEPTRPAPTPKPTPTPTNPGYGLGTGTSRGSAAMGQSAVAVAKTRLGAPYVWGGTGPGYDCSGLTMTSWSAAGVGLNRTSRDQYKQVLKISYSSMRPGDLVFWGTNPNDPNSVYHVAMYIGGGQIIEAPRPGLTVRIAPMRYYDAMPYAGRP